MLKYFKRPFCLKTFLEFWTQNTFFKVSAEQKMSQSLEINYITMCQGLKNNNLQFNCELFFVL